MQLKLFREIVAHSVDTISSSHDILCTYLVTRAAWSNIGDTPQIDPGYAWYLISSPRRVKIVVSNTGTIKIRVKGLVGSLVAQNGGTLLNSTSPSKLLVAVAPFNVRTLQIQLLQWPNKGELASVSGITRSKRTVLSETRVGKRLPVSPQSRNTCRNQT